MCLKHATNRNLKNDYIISPHNELMIKFPNVRDIALKRINHIKSANIFKHVALKECKNCIEIVSKKLDVTKNNLCKNCKNILA